MALLQNIWWYLVLIGVMILVHELGHYWAARFSTSRSRPSALVLGRGCSGFGAAKPTSGFSLILFGGYVKMAGRAAAGELLRGRG